MLRRPDVVLAAGGLILFLAIAALTDSAVDLSVGGASVSDISLVLPWCAPGSSSARG